MKGAQETGKGQGVYDESWVQSQTISSRCFTKVAQASGQLAFRGGFNTNSSYDFLKWQHCFKSQLMSPGQTQPNLSIPHNP